MPAFPWTLAFAIGFALLQTDRALASGEADALFQSDDALEVRIVAPMVTLLSKRPFEEELPGSFEYSTSAGETVELDLKIRTRGRFRRQKEVCAFPPLRLNFKTSQTKDTLFRHQDKLKLVTHCQPNKKYNQALLREYLAYKVLNALTDNSFRVRLLRIAYVDSEGTRSDANEYGFLIEHRDRLAARLGLERAEIPRTSVDALDPEHTNLTSVFHFLIGNTDFSPVMGARDEHCCHNHVLFGKNRQAPYRSIPYDFDQSGFVSAPHSSPNPRFRLRSVRERLYRGRCVNNDRLDATLALFRTKKAEILALIDAEPGLSGSSRKALSNYVSTFYALLESERRVEGEILKKCI